MPNTSWLPGTVHTGVTNFSRSRLNKSKYPVASVAPTRSASRTRSPVIRTKDGRIESTMARKRSVRGRLAGPMCVSEACTKLNSAGAGARARPNANARPAELESMERQKAPTLR
jgi:hypothetical protein